MTTQITEESEIITRLRELQAQHQSGAISITEFDAAYRRLDQEAGVLCACGRGIVTIRSSDGGPVICAACWLAEAAR